MPRTSFTGGSLCFYLENSLQYSISSQSRNHNNQSEISYSYILANMYEQASEHVVYHIGRKKISPFTAEPKFIPRDKQ